jgi:hypothetical protein
MDSEDQQKGGTNIGLVFAFIGILLFVAFGIFFVVSKDSWVNKPRCEYFTD